MLFNLAVRTKIHLTLFNYFYTTLDNYVNNCKFSFFEFIERQVWHMLTRNNVIFLGSFKFQNIIIVDIAAQNELLLKQIKRNY